MNKYTLLIFGLIFMPVAMNQRDHILHGVVEDTAGNPMAGVMVRAAEVYCNELDQCAMLVDLAYTPAAVTDELGAFEIRTTDFPRNASIGFVISYQDGEFPVPCFYQFETGTLALGWWPSDEINVTAGRAVCPTLEELGW